MIHLLNCRRLFGYFNSLFNIIYIVRNYVLWCFRGVSVAAWLVCCAWRLTDFYRICRALQSVISSWDFRWLFTSLFTVFLTGFLKAFCRLVLKSLNWSIFDSDYVTSSFMYSFAHYSNRLLREIWRTTPHILLFNSRSVIL